MTNDWFFNPYHFVPSKSGTRSTDLNKAEFEAGRAGNITHARYMNNSDGLYYSGRVLCRLTTQTPVIIGGMQPRPDSEPPDEQDEVKLIQPFEMDGKPAIPASSLKGLISSMAEAASNSSLRALKNEKYSRRAEVREGLSAIGMIIEDPNATGHGRFRLRPLALPTLMPSRISGWQLPKQYRIMFPMCGTPPLRVYIGNRDSIKDNKATSGQPIRTFTPEEPEYYYAKLAPRRWGRNFTIAPDPKLHIKSVGSSQFLLAQDTVNGVEPVSENLLPPNKRSGYTRGILRVLGVKGREKQIPRQKEHELFIPYPEGIETGPTFPISKSAIDVFNKLADARTRDSKDASVEQILPYHLYDTKRNTDAGDDKHLRLKAGDLVYFLPGSDGKTVEEISFSSVWRKSLPEDTYRYFSRISPELLPFNKDRTIITIAEQLFGFTQKDNDAKNEGQDSLALAGRIRFSYGVLPPDTPGKYYLGATPLKILGSPKPPYPPFYFKNSNNARFITKADLGMPDDIPQGRKFYLHSPQYDSADPPWKTLQAEAELQKHKKVMVQAAPLRAGLSFYFHLDFDNLSPAELGFLCYSLRPTEEFRHKIGMGKSIGLGTVAIEPLAICYIDREKRYGEDINIFTASRYHAVWVRDGEEIDHWPAFYSVEASAAKSGSSAPPPATFTSLRDDFRRTMDPDIRQALELIGNPNGVDLPVHVPQLAGLSGPYMEKDTFRWFVANTKQRLKPINAKTDTLKNSKLNRRP
jgi:CRISPR-associated protein (TIGR03986 family)